MSLLRTITKSRRRTYLTVAAIIALAAAIRLYNIGWSFSNNGVDEGVMIQRALLLSRGFELYNELPCDQAPLAFYIGALFRADVVTLRALNAAMSMGAILACMTVSRKIGGDIAMVVTGLFLSVDFAFVRESRLFSLDGMAAYFLAFGLLAFFYYAQKKDRVALFLAGALMGVAAAVKLLGALGLLALILFLGVEALRERSFKLPRAVDVCILVAAGALPMVVLMLVLGPSEMLQGMLFNQTHREFELFFKLSILAYLGLNLSYVLPLAYAKDLWNVGPEVRYLMIVAMVILVFMIVQPLVFFHHLVLMSPALAILAGFVTEESLKSKKGDRKKTRIYHKMKKGKFIRRFATVVVMIDIAASMGLAFYGMAAQDKPSEIVYAEKLRGMSADGDYVLCGDPLISAYADRLTPPGVVNVAYRRYPQLTLDMIADAIETYNVSVVVVCFRLKEIDDLRFYLRESGFELVDPRFIGHGDDTVLDLFEGSIDPVYFYIKPEVASLYGVPLLWDPKRI
jgi:4-amino-4-deoxy-L-arabinose transferase-like glycosyltransferase